MSLKLNPLRKTLVPCRPSEHCQETKLKQVHPPPFFFFFLKVSSLAYQSPSQGVCHLPCPTFLGLSLCLAWLLLITLLIKLQTKTAFKLGLLRFVFNEEIIPPQHRPDSCGYNYAIKPSWSSQSFSQPSLTPCTEKLKADRGPTGESSCPVASLGCQSGGTPISGISTPRRRTFRFTALGHHKRKDECIFSYQSRLSCCP